MQRELCQSGFTVDWTSLVMTSSFIQGSANSEQNYALRLCCIFFFQFFKDKGVYDTKLPLKLCFYMDRQYLLLSVYEGCVEHHDLTSFSIY